VPICPEKRNFWGLKMGDPKKDRNEIQNVSKTAQNGQKLASTSKAIVNLKKSYGSLGFFDGHQVCGF
jgi:hypothetical protein